MIEIFLTDLNKSNFYEETLKTIERICDDYGIDQHFGTLSMANQMVCDFLDTKPSFSIDVAFQIESDEVTFNYLLQGDDFREFSENQNQENTGLFVLGTLADDVTFSSGFDLLTTTFHVKTKFNIQRQLTKQQVRSRVFNS